jgi:4-amino-4-deoxy-L-arabinose transferase-like glycosyltransferase
MVVRRKTIPKNYLLILVVIVSGLLRLLFLDKVPSSLFTHEITPVYQSWLYMQGMINLPPAAIISYALQGVFVSYVFGPSLFMARLPSAMYGILLVIITFKLGREMFGEKVGLLSSILVALSPWGILISRHQVPSSAVVFYITLLALFMYRGTKSTTVRDKIIYYGTSSIILSLSINLHVYAAPFSLLFVIGYILIFNMLRKSNINSKTIKLTLICLALTAITIFPLIYLYLSPQVGPVQVDPTYQFAYSTFAHSQNALDFTKLVLKRFYLHLSPDFLVFTGGFSFAVQEGFREMIASEGLLKYSTGIVGMLNYWGILIYPAMFYLTYRILKKKNTREEKLLLWWIIAYALASGIAYYDNPNAARNIFGLPALTIAISLFVNRSYGFIKYHINQTLAFLLVLGIVILILTPTVYFLNDYYFGSYSTRSARSFDYGLSECAQFLSKENLWEKPIYLYNLYRRNWGLAFYSPQQPTDPNRFIALPPAFDFSHLSPKRAFIQIFRPLNFEEGVIEYRMKLVEGYGGASSASIQLLSGESNLLILTIYADDSTYAPSSYALHQKVDGKGYDQLHSLNKRIDYDIWYTIRLEITFDKVALYLNGDTYTWSRPGSYEYTTIKLAGESASVSFANLRINGNEIDFNSGWERISGTWRANQKSIYGDAGIILIIHGSEDLQTFLTYNIKHKILQNIRNPDGSLAFTVISIP